MNHTKLIKPNWPAPENIKAFSTTRGGGISLAPFDSLNLALHVGDDENNVRINRNRLTEQLTLPCDPIWLNQTHSDTIICADEKPLAASADASFTKKANIPCVVMTADCLPILLCNKQGTRVAAIHAGWQGLANGIIESSVKAYASQNSDIFAWLGPAIGPNAFEVGDDVKSLFTKSFPTHESAFKKISTGKWLANIYLLAKQRLNKLGIHQIYGGEYCTYTNEKQFFSYRRDKQTGRMATLIWME